jgi:hypothetical protein
MKTRFFNPYIGITDFMNFQQVQQMLAVFKTHVPAGSKRKLHVGVMMSYKTLHGLPTKWEKAFPDKDEIAKIFWSDKTYNCLHYADYDWRPNLWDSITKALFYGGCGIHALQLDVIWPEPVQIANGVHASRKNVEVILQVGANALDAVGNDPEQLIKKLSEYDGIIHRILLDKSMGKGVGMDAKVLLPFARAVREAFPKLGIGVAGGLGPETMSLIEPMIQEFPDLSIDAQGRLRPSCNALDPIDWTMASKYLVESLKLLK